MGGSRSCVAEPPDGHLPEGGIGVPGTLIHQDEHVPQIPELPEDGLLHKLKWKQSSPLGEGVASLGRVPEAS